MINCFSNERKDEKELKYRSIDDQRFIKIGR